MHKERPDISILMPVYTMSGYLEACIRTIQSQKNVSWELLAVDDFSTDDSLKKLNEFARGDERISVLQNTHKGIIPALDLAFKNATGTYITRMDADDLMPSAKLELLLKIAQKDPKKIATGFVKYFSDFPVSEGYTRYEKWLNNVAEQGSFETNIYRECMVASPNWMVHRSCFENHIPFNKLAYPEDYDLVFQWYKNGYSFEAAAEVTHLWREHPQRTSRNSDIYQQETFFKLKTNYFIDLELRGENYVQLIGGGVKGKLVAAVLTARNISFDWFDYGKNQSGSNLKPVEKLQYVHKTILTNWPVDSNVQQEIRTFLAGKKMELGKNTWLF
jgi:glycosyltransferase involved in cell wall biosynthesis